MAKADAKRLESPKIAREMIKNDFGASQSSLSEREREREREREEERVKQCLIRRERRFPPPQPLPTPLPPTLPPSVAPAQAAARMKKRFRSASRLDSLSHWSDLQL